MTEMQFNYWLLSIRNIISSCNEWFFTVLFESGAFTFYLSCITIFLFVKYLIVPFVGRGMGTGKSDKAKPPKSADKVDEI